ncbi:helix-turn-helix domain-containing protein, partial [Brevibacillus borstelensis]
TMRAEGKSIREIARLTGHSRNTVRRYLRGEFSPEKGTRKSRGSKLDPFKPFLQERLQEGIYNARCYSNFYKKRDTVGRTIPILKDYVKDFRPPKQVPAVLRYETKLGEYA